MDAIIATVVGVLGTAWFGFLGWCFNELVIKPLKDIRHEQQIQHDRQAILRHVLTQAILRIESLENEAKMYWKQHP